MVFSFWIFVIIIMVITLIEKACELLQMFYSSGYEAYVVGGFVRDIILGRNSFDVDIATNATPKEVQMIFKDVKLPFEGYGSVHLVYKKVNFEITTYRMDLEYQDKRKPSKIVYTDKLIIDLRRRDFTMNTLCMDKNKNIIDLLNARCDIENKVIKTVGNANRRLKEDSLRILRAIRFATELDFSIDEELKDAIINNRELVKDLSFYRKKQELNRIFSSPNVLKGISLLKYFSLDEYLDIDLKHEIVKTSDPIGIWAQVSPSSSYPFTSNEKDYLKAINDVLTDDVINDMELYKKGNYVCFIAAQILNMDTKDIYDRCDNLVIKKTSDIKLTGKDIIDLINPKDKSIIKNIIKDIEEKIIYKELNNNYEELKRYVLDNYKKYW